MKGFYFSFCCLNSLIKWLRTWWKTFLNENQEKAWNMMTTTRHYRNRNLKTYRGKTWKILEIWHLQKESWKSGLVLLNELSRIHSSSLLGSGKFFHHLISTSFFTTHSLFSPELYAGLDHALSILWQPAKEMVCLKCIPHLAEQLRHLMQCASTVQRVHGRTGWSNHLYFTLPYLLIPYLVDFLSVPVLRLINVVSMPESLSFLYMLILLKDSNSSFNLSPPPFTTGVLPLWSEQFNNKFSSIPKLISHFQVWFCGIPWMMAFPLYQKFKKAIMESTFISIITSDYMAYVMYLWNW